MVERALEEERGPSYSYIVARKIFRSLLYIIVPYIARYRGRKEAIISVSSNI